MNSETIHYGPFEGQLLLPRSKPDLQPKELGVLFDLQGKRYQSTVLTQEGAQALIEGAQNHGEAVIRLGRRAHKLARRFEENRPLMTEWANQVPHLDLFDEPESQDSDLEGVWITEDPEGRSHAIATVQATARAHLDHLDRAADLFSNIRSVSASPSQKRSLEDEKEKVRATLKELLDGQRTYEHLLSLYVVRNWIAGLASHDPEPVKPLIHSLQAQVLAHADEAVEVPMQKGDIILQWRYDLARGNAVSKIIVPHFLANSGSGKAATLLSTHSSTLLEPRTLSQWLLDLFC